MMLLSVILSAVGAAAVQTAPIQTVEALAMGATPIAEEAAAEEAAAQDWKGKVTVSLSSTDGNASEKGAYADLKMAKELENGNRLSVSAFWTFRQSKAAGITQRTSSLETKYDVAINDASYYYGIATAESKLESDLDLRWSVGVGLGHTVVEKEDYKASVEIGVSHVDESYTINNADDDSYVSGRFGYDVVWDYSDKLKFENNASLLFSLDDTDDTSSRMVTAATYKMTASMLAQAGWIWEWDNTPASGSGKDDNLYTISLGWTF
ncbi:MAG: DUF481 domain-containing protein [Planctomycetes bacterium]|nr:DUF481 domain-containing protein [Planctomycetota bacterium]